MLYISFQKLDIFNIFFNILQSRLQRILMNTYKMHTKYIFYVCRMHVLYISKYNLNYMQKYIAGYMQNVFFI